MTSISGSAPIAAVVQRAAAGDAVAFARIVAACHPDMLRVAFAVCGDLDLAEDAVQSAWLIAWRKLRTLRDPHRVHPWLVAVAANEARHALRRRHSASVTELELDRVADDARRDPADDIGRVDLANALRHLAPEERALLALRYVAGFDSTELAPALGISSSGIRVRLLRALGRLRKELDDE